MNKGELVKAIASRTLTSQKQVTVVLDSLLEVISEEVANGGKVMIVGFGSFEVTERKEREGRNPQTGESMTIPATKVPTFSPGKALKDKVAGKVPVEV